MTSRRARQGRDRGGLAAPIFKEFMGVVLKDTPVVDFQVPEGMKLIAINRKTGMRANEGEGGTIIEAFKPGTGPADSYWVIGMGDETSATGRGAVAAGFEGHHGRRRRPLLTALPTSGGDAPGRLPRFTPGWRDLMVRAIQSRHSRS